MLPRRIARIRNIAPCLLRFRLRGFELRFEILALAHRDDVRLDLDVTRLSIGQIFVGTRPLRRNAGQTRFAFALQLFQRRQLLPDLRQLVLPLAPQLAKPPLFRFRFLGCFDGGAFGVDRVLRLVENCLRSTVQLQKAVLVR